MFNEETAAILVTMFGITALTPLFAVYLLIGILRSRFRQKRPLPLTKSLLSFFGLFWLWIIFLSGRRHSWMTATALVLTVSCAVGLTFAILVERRNAKRTPPNT